MADDWEPEPPRPEPPVRPPRREEQGEQLMFQIGSRDVGKVIGKGGCVIRELQDKTGVRIKVDSTNDRRSFETDVTLSNGPMDKLENARKVIEELLGYNDDVAQGMSKMNMEETKDEPIDWGRIKEEHEEQQKIRWSKCPKLIKDFYEEHPDVTKMTSAEVAKFRMDNNNIVISNFKEDSEAPLMKPTPEFHHAFFKFPDILKTIRKQGFERPSPIQAQAWPYLLAGKDLIGIAQTGTGKTLGFLLPAFIHIDNQPVPRGKRGGPNVLVLSPTRELALQIADEVKKYEYKGIRSVCVYGGGDRRKQMKVVTDGVEIIIATPGRLNDLVQAGCIQVESVTYLILDEADRMLDMGFEPQIRKVLLDIRPDRQTVMTSATWPEGVRRLASQYMDDPVTVFIGTLDLAAVTSVKQEIIFAEEEEKREILMEFFDTMEPDDKVIVFVGKKVKCDDISSDLSLAGVACQSIHGDREQSDREQALADLKEGEVKILIATDVASRGIDITDITHVFNYDFPRNIEEYVHRVGRTGRAGKTGTAITIMERRDWRNAEELIEIMTNAKQEVPRELVEMATRYEKFKVRREAEKAEFRNNQRESGGDGCFKCGGFGHMSRECPDGGGFGGFGGGGRGGRGGRGGDGCFKCGGQGHISRNCPQNGGSRNGGGGGGGGRSGGRPKW